MKVLITGGLGWLGKALSEQVSTRHSVCAFDLERPDVERERSEFEGDVLYGSVTDYAAVLAAVEGQDAVIHAAVASTVTRGQYDDVTDATPVRRQPQRHLQCAGSHAAAGCGGLYSYRVGGNARGAPGRKRCLDGSATYFGLPSYYEPDQVPAGADLPVVRAPL